MKNDIKWRKWWCCRRLGWRWSWRWWWRLHQKSRRARAEANIAAEGEANIATEGEADITAEAEAGKQPTSELWKIRNDFPLILIHETTVSHLTRLNDPSLCSPLRPLINQSAGPSALSYIMNKETWQRDITPCPIVQNNMEKDNCWLGMSLKRDIHSSLNLTISISHIKFTP